MPRSGFLSHTENFDKNNSVSKLKKWWTTEITLLKFLSSMGWVTQPLFLKQGSKWLVIMPKMQMLSSIQAPQII